MYFETTRRVSQIRPNQTTRHSITSLRHQMLPCTSVTGLRRGSFARAAGESNQRHSEAWCLPRQACPGGRCASKGGTEEKKGGGFHQPADAASPETCCSNCSFCSSSCSADSFCEDRTIGARRRHNIKRAAGTQSPGGGRSGANKFHSGLESKSRGSTEGAGVPAASLQNRSHLSGLPPCPS